MVVSQRGSAVDLALTLLALALLQSVLTLIGGVLIDRFDARFVVLLADSLRAVTACALAFVAGNAVAHLWLVWVILLVHGTGNALYSPAANSLAPHLVAAEDVERANALSAALVQIGPLVGFLLAGLLVSTGGPVLAFGLNAISYGVAVFMALLMRPLQRTQQQNLRRLVWHEIGEAARYLRTVPWLLCMFVMDSLVAFSAIATTSVGVPLLAKTLHTGVQGYGVLAWSSSGGALLGLLVSALYPPRSRRGLLCIGCQSAEAILMAMIAFVPLPLGALCMMAWSALNGLLVVVTLSLIQQCTPTPLLGRVMAFWMLASTGMMPFAQVAGGLIATAIGAQALFALAGGIVLLGGLLGWWTPALRQYN